MRHGLTPHHKVGGPGPAPDRRASQFIAPHQSPLIRKADRAIAPLVHPVHASNAAVSSLTSTYSSTSADPMPALGAFSPLPILARSPQLWAYQKTEDTKIRKSNERKTPR